MKLHVFNPEHDIALAHGSPFFTAPKAGRGLRRDCGFLPIIWAGEEDKVLVDDVDDACRAYRQVMKSVVGYANVKVGENISVVYENISDTYENISVCYKNISVGYEEELKRRFVRLSDLRSLPITEVCPWGWDMALVHQLKRAGVGEDILPSTEKLDEIRRLSSRKFAAELLPKLVGIAPNVLIGEAVAASSMEDLLATIKQNVDSMLKAPWSSSGRGLLRVESVLSDHQLGWAKNVLEQQGTVMVEPLYNKVVDFGMEFFSTGETVAYRGLSVFETVNGSYVGNLLATEQEKTSLLTPYVDECLLTKIREAVCKYLEPHLRNKYRGPLGVDMMIVRTSNGLKLHPMVEINLRQTMGHVAIALTKRLASKPGRMRIDYADGRYHLSIEKRK